MMKGRCNMVNFNFDKFIFITDNHYCINSSVVTGRKSERYSDRIENQLKSIEWVHSLGYPVVHGGDFFNNSIITSEEQSSLNLIKNLIKDWVFLRGNHESSGEFDLLGALGDRVIRVPTEAMVGKMKTLFLPFNSKEDDIKGHYDLIIGHVGLEGIPYGAKGLDFGVIDKSCDFFLNGHLHNRVELSTNKWNTGSLTAQNFSDNCLEYRKGVVLVDTINRTLEFIENPYAFNFFKFTWSEYLKKYRDSEVGEAIRRNTSCLSVSCKYGEKIKINNSGDFDNVYYLRVSEESQIERIAISKPPVELDHLSRFRNYFLSKVGESELVLQELSEVLNG
jgi:DNA repair exonuclease SbcCD nuclease subunit